MNRIILIILAAVPIILLASCNEKYETFQTYFWTSRSGSTNYLFVNDTNKGVLPYLPVAPSCGDDVSKQQTLHFPLESGTYRIAVIDKQGVTKYEETFTIKLTNHTKSISTSSGNSHGGARNVTEGNCLIQEIYY